MAISRILGASLVSDLDRQGVDLQFTTSGNALVYMDFANFRLGVNTPTPSEPLEVTGNVLISNGNLLTNANLTYSIGTTSNWFKNIYANTVTSDSFVASKLTGTLLTNAQPNITSLGTLTGLTVSGNLNVTASNLQPSANLTSSIGTSNRWWSTLYANTITATGFVGTILTGNQPNITNLGNISVYSISIGSSLSLTGNITANVIRANQVYDGNNRVLTSATTITVNGADVSGSGTSSNVYLTLSNTGVTPGVYGSADDEYADRIPKITVDSKGRITNIANVTLTQVGNVSFNNTTISANDNLTISAAGNINLNAQGNGIVQISGTDAFGLPKGDTIDRPNNPAIGYLRYNLETQNIEYYNGNTWIGPGSAVISSEIITPNGVTNTFTLSAQSATTNGVLVSINGTLQQPFTSYEIINGQLILNEVPASTDIIEVRSLTSGGTVSASQLRISGANVLLSTGTVTVSGNLVPFASNAYSIGSSTNQWNDLFLTGAVKHSGNTIVAVNSNQTVTIDSFSTTMFRTAKYILQATRGSEYQSAEILVTHNGTTAYNTVYGVINTGNILGNVSATISSGNVLLEYTPSYTNTSVRLAKSYIIL